MSQELEQSTTQQPSPAVVKAAEESDPVDGLWLNNNASTASPLPKKQLSLIIAIVAALCCIGLLGGIVSWFGHQQTPILFTIFVTDQEDEGISPVPFGFEDSQITTSGNVFDRISTSRSASNDREQNTNILQKMSEVPSNENIVLYICARSMVNDQGKVAILSSDSRLEQSISGGTITNTILLEEIFNRMASCKATQKLLILDIFNPIISIPAGITNQDIPRRVEDEFRSRNHGIVATDKNATPFKLLMSCSPGQYSRTSPPLGHSVFCHFLSLALNGELPTGSRSNIKRLGKVHLSDLQDYMFPHVDRWVEENDLERQTPQILGYNFLNEKDMLLAIPKIRFVPSQSVAKKVASTFHDSINILPDLRRRWIGIDKNDTTNAEGSSTGQKADEKKTAGIKNEDNDKEKVASSTPGDAGKDKDLKSENEKSKENKNLSSNNKTNSKPDNTLSNKNSEKGVPEIITEAWKLHDRWIGEGVHINHPRIMNRTASIARNALLCFLLGLAPERYTDRIKFALEQTKDQLLRTVQTTNLPTVYSNLGMLLDSGNITENAPAITMISNLVLSQKPGPFSEQELDQLAGKLIDEFKKSNPGLSCNDLEYIFVNSTLAIPNLSATKINLINKMLRLAIGQSSLKTAEARLLDRLSRLSASSIFDAKLARECLKINLACSKASAKWRVYARLPFFMERMAEKCIAGTWLTENCMGTHGLSALEFFEDAERLATFLEGVNTVLREASQTLWNTVQDIAAYQTSPVELPAGWETCCKNAIEVLDRLSDLDTIKNETTIDKATTIISLLRISVDNLSKSYEGVHILVNPSSIVDFEKLSNNDQASPAILQELNANLRLGRISLQDRLKLINIYFRVSDKTAQFTLKKEADEMLAGLPPPIPAPYDKPSLEGLNTRDIPFLKKILLGIISLKIMNPDLMKPFTLNPELEIEAMIEEVRSGKGPTIIEQPENLPQGKPKQIVQIGIAETKQDAFYFPNLGRLSLRTQFGNINLKKDLLASCNNFLRDSFMKNIQDTLLSDKRMAYRINLGYPGWISNEILDNPEKNPFIIKENEDRLNHLAWFISRLRHASRLGLDREFNADIVGLYGAKYDFFPNSGLTVVSPNTAQPPAASQPISITIPWINEGFNESDLSNMTVRLVPGNCFPFDAKISGGKKTSSGGNVDITIERLPETASIITKNQTEFVIEFNINQRLWFSRVTVDAENDGTKPTIFIYDKPEGGIALGSELNLRGSGSVKSIFPKIRQESGKPISYNFSLKQSAGGTTIGPIPLNPISGITTNISFVNKNNLDNPKEISQSSTQQGKASDMNQGAYLIHLPGKIDFDLRDPALGDKPIVTRSIQLNRIDPADLVELVSAETNTDLLSGSGPSRKSYLRVSLRAKRLLKDAPPCRVQIILDNDLPGSPITNSSGNISGIVPPDGKSLLVLEAFGVTANQPSFAMSQFTLSVDGLPMTYRFNADFQPGGQLESPQLLRLPALGLKAKSAIAAKPPNPSESILNQDPVLSIEAWASQAPSGSTLRLTLLGGAQFKNPERIELLPGPMKSFATLQSGEKGAWEFTCEEGPWKLEWQTAGLRGRKKMLLELLDNQGNKILSRETDIIIDPTPPRFGQFFGLPEKVGPGSTHRFSFILTDPESSIASVTGYMGPPAAPSASGNIPPILPAPVVQVITGENTFEAVVSIPNDAKGFVTINLKGVNGAGLETSWTKTIAVDEKLTPPPPSIQGIVTEAGRPQKGLTVILKDEKGKDLEKAVTDESGAYLIANLKPGKATIEVAKRTSGRFAKKPVVLQPGPPLQVDLAILE